MSTKNRVPMTFSVFIVIWIMFHRFFCKNNTEEFRALKTPILCMLCNALTFTKPIIISLIGPLKHTSQ